MQQATADYLTTQGAARLAERSSETIRRWANTGRLPVARTESGMRLFQREDVLRVVAESEAARRARTVA